MAILQWILSVTTLSFLVAMHQNSAAIYNLNLFMVCIMRLSFLDSKITVYFTPWEDYAQQVINTIDQSEKSILVQ